MHSRITCLNTEIDCSSDIEVNIIPLRHSPHISFSFPASQAHPPSFKSLLCRKNNFSRNIISMGFSIRIIYLNLHLKRKDFSSSFFHLILMNRMNEWDID